MEKKINRIKQIKLRSEIEKITINNCRIITNNWDRAGLNDSQAAAWNVVWTYLRQNGMQIESNHTGIKHAIIFINQLLSNQGGNDERSVATEAQSGNDSREQKEKQTVCELRGIDGCGVFELDYVANLNKEISDLRSELRKKNRE